MITLKSLLISNDYRCVQVILVDSRWKKKLYK